MRNTGVLGREVGGHAPQGGLEPCDPSCLILSIAMSWTLTEPQHGARHLPEWHMPQTRCEGKNELLKLAVSGPWDTWGPASGARHRCWPPWEG